jgi:2-polyprenyl-3-methyl-5-hydroxy-6-metoxy-1,4-benzoquinol methylase
MAEINITCWVCGGQHFALKKKSDVQDNLNSENFAITNFEYGKTGELQQCQTCGFIQCIDLDEVIKFYEDLEDPEYENTRKERKLQEERLIRYFKKYKETGTLLDIGAGSGIMVEAALEQGYQAEGIEPSKWLQQNAQKLGLPVHQGIFPHSKTPGPFDIISFVDVIEHVTEPGNLLADIKNALADEGILVLVTPDVSSLAAKVLGYKWWHYRIAHIGYFNKKNLTRLLNTAGFDIIKITRPSWYFTLKYLGVRFLSFFPKFLRFPLPNFLEKITIPVNLRDSLLVVAKKEKENA